MRTFLKCFFAIILIIGVVGAVAVRLMPDKPSDAPSTDTETNTKTDTGAGSMDEDSGHEDVSGPITVEVSTFKELKSTISECEENTHIVINTDIVATESMSIDKDITIETVNTFSGASFNISDNKQLILLNGKYNGIDIDGEGTLVLENVVSVATAEDDSGLSLSDEADITVNIVGEVVLTGAINGDGIEIPETAAFVLTGDSLFAKGNNGFEYSTVEGYGNTDDEAYFNKTGSGIGNAHNNVGSITVKDMKSLTAEGYGNKAFGIGGCCNLPITIENTTVEYAKGGFAQPTFLTDQKGKGEEEGGAAIGVGFLIDGEYGAGKVTLNNTIIKKADGGSKSAGIGAIYWTAVEIKINNCILENITGGNASAGIGGSRASSDAEGKQYINILINDSVISARGGEYGAGIGSGYDTYCSINPSSPCHIEISGNSNITAKGGKYGAGIGTGYHCAGLSGFIAEGVTVDASCGDENFYKDTYTTAQNIGYGVTDPTREMSLEVVTFTVGKEVIGNPVELIGGSAN